MIKQFILQTLLCARYHVGFSKGKHWVRKYFWRLEPAKEFARNHKAYGKTTVWRRDWKRMFTHNNLVDYSTHEDAKKYDRPNNYTLSNCTRSARGYRIDDDHRIVLSR
jgi:hypothetical protein